MIAKGLFSSNVTEAASKDEKEVKSQTTGTLFNFSNQATAGAGTTGGQTLFGGTTGTLFGGQGLKSTAPGGASSVFSSGSLFGGAGLG